jgi:hypothetical protein
MPTSKKWDPTDNVSAEQHALDNPGHVCWVSYSEELDRLVLRCQSCDWWDHQ